MSRIVALCIILSGIPLRSLTQNAEYWVEEGKKKFYSLDFQSASSRFEKAVDLEPNNSIAINLLGQSRMAENKCSLAVIAFTKAIEIDAERAILYNNRGLAYQCLGLHENALMDFRHSIFLYPNLDVAHYNCGVSNTVLENFTEALKNLNEAILLNPCKEIYYNQRGKLRFKLKNYENALVDFSQAVACNPIFGNAHYNKALTLARLGKVHESIHSLDMAIAINPSEYRYFEIRGVAYLNLLKFSTAILDFDAAISLNPLSANAYYYKGIALRKMGKHSDALVAINRAVFLGNTCLEGLPNPFIVPEKGLDSAISNVWPVSIGIGKYDQSTEVNFKLRPLETTETSADYFHKIFDPYSTDGILFNSLVGGQATHDNIIAKLKDVTNNKNIKPNDLVVVYFGGHGALIQKSTILFPYETVDGRDYIPEDSIIEIVKKSPAKHKIIFIDACRSPQNDNDIYPDRTSMHASPPSDISKTEISKNREDVPAGMIIIRSSESGQLSFEYPLKKGKISFSTILISGLQGAANEDDDQYISVGEIFSYLTKEFNNLRFANKQTPTISIDKNDPRWNLKLVAIPGSISAPSQPID